MDRNEKELLIAQTKAKIYTSIGLWGFIGICIVSLFSKTWYVTMLFGIPVIFRLLALSLTNFWVFVLTVICIFFFIYGVLQERKSKKLQQVA